jgi:hypothetical protein
LLLMDSNKVFGGLGWLAMAPIAAQWNPFGSAVMRNTVDYMVDRLSRPWEGLTWLPTDSWPDGSFTPSIIGKGIGWELEQAAREKRYRRIVELVDLVEYLHRDSSIYMESAFLHNGEGGTVPIIMPEGLARYRQAYWRLADPGNGEQVSWWCWAVANLRKRLGLSAAPERVTPSPVPDSLRPGTPELSFKEEQGTSLYYTLDGTAPSESSARYSGPITITPPMRVNVVARRDGMLASNAVSFDFLRPENGLQYSFSTWEKSAPDASPMPVVVRSGAVKRIEIPVLPENGRQNLLACEGFLKLEKDGEYVFRVRSCDPAALMIDGRPVASTDETSAMNGIRLEKGFRSFRYEVKTVRRNSSIDISFSRNGSAFEVVPPEMLFQKVGFSGFVETPEILPIRSEFDDDDTLSVEIKCPAEGATIRYTLDGTDPTGASAVYAGPIAISRSLTVKAAALVGTGEQSSLATMRYLQISHESKISLRYEPNPRYAAGGAGTLIDGMRGTMDLAAGQWLGFHGTDFEALLDFRKIKQVREASVGLLHNPESWIFLPKKLHLSISRDGVDFEEISTLDVAPTEMEKPEIRDVALLKSAVDCRFLKIRAENFGACPPWHKAAGNSSWLFVDEIIIR